MKFEKTIESYFEIIFKVLDEFTSKSLSSMKESPKTVTELRKSE